jgi:hypothetical protein
MSPLESDPRGRARSGASWVSWTDPRSTTPGSDPAPPAGRPLPDGGTRADSGTGPERDALTELERSMNDLPPRGSLTVREAVRLGLLAVLIVLVGGGLGFVSSLLVPNQYAARMELLFPIAVEQPTGFLREDRNLTTQLLLLQSRAVLTEVAEPRGLTAEALRQRLSVEVVESSEIIGVEVRDPSREEGLALVDEVVSRYLAIANGERDDPVRDYVQSELDRTRVQLQAAPEDEGLREREQALVAQLDAVTTAELARPRPSVLVPAYSVEAPASGGPTLPTTAGMLVGALVAGAAVLWLARRRTRR